MTPLRKLWKQSLKDIVSIANDWVDASMFVLALFLSVRDFIMPESFGAVGFLTVYIFMLLFRNAIMRRQIKDINSKNG